MSARGAAAGQALTFRVGERRLTLDAGRIAEVVRTPVLTRVPNAPPALAGVASVRGQVIPVVWLGRVLDQGQAGAASRVIVLSGAEALGLAVDEVSELGAPEAGADLGDFTETVEGRTQSLDLEVLLVQAFAALRTRTRVRAERAAEPEAADLALADLAFLEFEVGGQAYALPLEQVRAVAEAPERLAALPDSHPAVVGVTTFREAELPVACLARLLGLAEPVGRGQVVVAAIGGSLVGLLVDKVRKILRAPEQALGPVPAVLNRGVGEARIDALVRTSDGLVAVLAAEQVFADETTAAILADVKREQDEMTDATDVRDRERFVLFRLGAETYGLPIAAVEEVMLMPPTLARAPRTPAFVAGVIDHRGVTIPVIDQRMRFAVEDGAVPLQRRILVACSGDAKAGFAVDAVEQILEVAPEDLKAAPEIAADGVPLFDRVARLELGGRLILLIDPEVLLNGAQRDLAAALARPTAAEPE